MHLLHVPHFRIDVALLYYTLATEVSVCYLNSHSILVNFLCDLLLGIEVEVVHSSVEF